MSNLDGVQKYEFFLIIVIVVVGLLVHGKRKVDQFHDFRDTFLSLLVGLPGIGRIFGWW